MKKVTYIKNQIAEPNVSESELAFLAFLFIVTLGCLMVGGRQKDSLIRARLRPNNNKREEYFATTAV